MTNGDATKAVFQVSFTVSEQLLGRVLASLPRGLNPHIARLETREARGSRGKPGEASGHVQPEVLKLIRKEPMRLAMVRQRVRGNSKSITSAFYALARKGLIKKNSDGNYEVVE